MHKKAVIVCNGDKTNVSRAKEHIDSQTLRIGCDGGTRHLLSLGFVPHAIVGDMDSLSKETKNKLKNQPVAFISYPKEKDNTDAELALLYAVEKGCKEIIICGVLGTRIDHMLATILMLSQPRFSQLNIRIIEGNQDIFVVGKKISLEGKKGDTISIMPLTNNVEGITTKNLKYKLSNATLAFGSTRGISNVLTKDKAEITLKKGTLLVVHQQQLAK